MNLINQNQNKVIVLSEYDNTTTNITLASGHGTTLQDVSTPYNLVWWNASDYLNPTDDPYVEIVKCIAKFGDTLVIMRSQQQTLASPKNIPGKLYNMAYLPDNNDNNLVTLSYYNVPQIHGKIKHDATTIDGGTALPIGQLPVHGISAHSGTIGTWANIDKTTSSIGDITTKSHTSLTDIGTNTHTTIDNHIAATGISVHGLGTISTQASSNVSITGGSITGITDITVADGGTGRSTTVPYAPICGGTTTTDAIQSVASIGTAGQVLTSNGAGALPTFQNIGSLTRAMMPTDVIMNSHDAQISTTSTSWVKMKTITLNGAYNGGIRIYFSANVGGWNGSFVAQIRKNGVAWGTARGVGPGGTWTGSEDFLSLALPSGTTIELWGYCSGGPNYWGAVNSFRLMYLEDVRISTTNS